MHRDLTFKELLDDTIEIENAETHFELSEDGFLNLLNLVKIP